LQVGNDLSLLSGVTEEQIKSAIDKYTMDSSDRNIDRVYDELSSNEIDIIFHSIEKTKENTLQQIGKATYKDFSRNPQSGIAAIEALEKGVRIQSMEIEDEVQGEK